MAKNLLPIDALVAGYLRDGIQESGLTYRQIAAKTGMSINRIGIILRQEPPPATIGETGQLAHVIDLSASALLARAEAELAGQSSEAAEPVVLSKRRGGHGGALSTAETYRAVASLDDGLPDAVDGDDLPNDPFHSA